MRGIQKPFLGAQIDPEHPFSKSLVTAVLWNEGCGTPNVLRGPGGIGTRPQPNQLVQTSGPGVPTWVSTPDGWAQRMGTTDYFELRSSGDNSGLWVPTDEITICIIRRKYDATLRNVPLCGLPSVWDSAECTIWYPSSSPVAFWGFGGHSAPNELVSGTLVTPSTVAERLVFHAGPRGSAIWQNGIKVASQSTAIGPRTTNTAAFQVNSGDTNDWIYLAIHSKQWSDDLCRWWSAEPYAHFASGCLQPTGANRKTARGRAAIQAAIAATVTTPVTTRRRRHYPYYHSGSF